MARLPASLLRTGLAAAALLLAAGCSSMATCNKPGAYADAVEMPPLRMPVGLDGPDTRQAMQIPALNEPEVPLADGTTCLEEPPEMPKGSGTPATAVPRTAPAAEPEQGKGRRPRAARSPRG